MRHPVRWLASLALLAAIVALALVLRRRPHPPRRRGARRATPARADARCPLAQTAAHDYNPFGTGPENRDEVQNVVDSDPNTTWSTEHYYDGTLKKAGGAGVGLYVDAAPGVVGQADRDPDAHARASPRRSTSPTTSTCRCPTATRPRCRTRLARPARRRPRASATTPASRSHLSGARYRYYLLWITTLPPGRQSASIAELTLFR